MKTTTIVAAWSVAAGSAVGPPAIGHAGNLDRFQSPSGNITCIMAALEGQPPEVECEIADHTWTAPPRPKVCMGGWGDRFDLSAGRPARLGCHTDTTRDVGLPTLDYGATRSIASITCESQTDGITCTDSGTGHFFRISRESYQLG